MESNKDDETIVREVIECLVNLRRRSGMSMDDLARKAKFSNKTVYDIEKGRNALRIRTLLKLCRGLGVSLKEVLTICENYKE